LSRPELACALVALLFVQGVTVRVEYRVTVVRSEAGGRRELARGLVSGPPETALRLALHADSIDVAALFSLEHMRDSDFTLVGEFYTERRLSRSRRGLPLWEHDSYERSTPLRWGRVARVFPLGFPTAGSDSSWVEVMVTRWPAGALLKPSESATVDDNSVSLTLEAVLRPRRAVVWLTLIRGDTASPPRRLDLLIDAPGRMLELPVGARDRRRLELALARPEPPVFARDRVLAADADLVCLRVSEPGGTGAVRAACGRLNNVSQRLALDGDDTLVATFAWPAAR
jgi:hypothetical protein